MNRSLKATLAAAAAVALSLPLATAAVWEFDGAHTSAGFSVKHLMITTVRGTFKGVKGAVEWDGKDAATIKIDASIDMTTVDTAEPKRDEHLKSPDFFDAAKFPTMTFKSKSAASAGAGKVKVVGDLTLRGVTKEVTLDVDGPTAEIEDPWGNSKVGATATTKINRQDFGVSWNKALDAGGVVVGDEVSVIIDLQLKKRPEEAKK
jgi:polyisoprenoid-binding protein YceI